ncbi:MAG TPA: glycoside hydrolase family 3 N-terminal domain-containing protein [Streptosporangiaceae bacterium]|jgi:beta-N-acetylhexosaminidase|nr:glycoside hydrolase family 3 N-terminal domain-containing protein [Streptosporangiaceae bacterium]
MSHRPARRITVLAIAACGTVAAAAAAGAVSASTVVGRAPAAPLTAAIPRLTPRQLAGQRVIYSYSGLNPPAALLTLIRNGEAAGVIFFRGNISSPAQISRVIATLEKANASPRSNPVRAPLLLMTDQEGGEVRRLPGAPVLSEKQIGGSAHPAAAATAAGTGAGRNLRGVGMNVNLAPVLDVFRTPGDFDDQFGRSYSMNPNVVSRLGANFITAQQHVGVAATAKHFPGLGAAARLQNTDVQPVTLGLPAATIRSDDELPYKAAIAAGVKLVMVSWAVYPSLGSKRPAGLSGLIIGGELRTRLRFKGVTITDALEAGALRPFGSIQNRAWLAARAGMDLILCSGQTPSEGEAALGRLESAYRNRTLNQAAFRAAVARILALRAGLPA